jgi:(p)ppGpp synthase/HD superfamily hydrolase
MSVITQALAFAYNAHGSIDQRRKYSGEPYIVHPIAVADIVKQYGGTQVQIAAALLHDVVEDTPVTLDIIEVEFGPGIATIVEGLTDVSKPEDGNRAVRKAIDREHTAQATASAQFVKCADLIHNTRCITAHDPDFARVYMQEKRELLSVMTKVRDSKLYAEAKRICDEYFAK